MAEAKTPFIEKNCKVCGKPLHRSRGESNARYASKETHAECSRKFKQQNSKHPWRNEVPLLHRLRGKMHNWFWVGCVYDWEMNPSFGKIWVYKDCTGVELKALDLEELTKLIYETGNDKL